MALLKNTIINGNLKVNSNINALGKISSNSVDFSNGLLTASGSTVSIDGDLNIMNAESILFNDNGNLRLTKVFSMINGEMIQINTNVMGGTYRPRLIDTILVSVFVDGYDAIISRNSISIASSGSGFYELSFPVTSNGGAQATFSARADNKIAYSASGILRQTLTAKANVTVVIEYTLQLTRVLFKQTA